jgi:hypothetical protein
MSPQPQPENSQPIETVQAKKGKSRIKPRQLSPLLQRIVVEQFAVRGSTEDIAEEFRTPVRTIADVVLLDILRQLAALRRPPGSAGRAMSVRGIA